MDMKQNTDCSTRNPWVRPLHFKTTPANWLMLSDGKGKSFFVFEPLLHAAVQSNAGMKKPKQKNSKKICALLDEQTKATVRNLLFGPKVREELKILARLAKDKPEKPSKPATEKPADTGDDRIAA